MKTNLKRGVVGVFAALTITTSSLLAEGKTYAVVNGDAITDTDIADAVGIGHYAVSNWQKLTQ